ncbi:MAG: CoA transferase [Firmicutes bacterium]|nr:CoA transferase [Bacillota bacterium]
MVKPLEGLLVLEFSQYLSGPSAALRLADMGARVIKIEKPGQGDGNRKLSLGLEIDGDSLLFHTTNRNKESYAVDLKDPGALTKIKTLIGKADVLVENFRPGVMKKLGLDYDSVRKFNPGLVYARVTGYGDVGPWQEKPGQDLLVQALSGLTWLNGNADQPPTPFGLAVADMVAGAHLVQGIMACLVRRGKDGQGGLVEVSLLESILDFQFEVLTQYLNDGGNLPQRGAVNSAHAYLGAPYGIYPTQDGFIALAMGSLITLAHLLDCPSLLAYRDPDDWRVKRDEIKTILGNHLMKKTTQEWLSILEPADYWCSAVFNWDDLIHHEAFSVLHMVQEVTSSQGVRFKTLRCPIRVDGEVLNNQRGAPRLGEHTALLEEEFALQRQ